MSSRGAVVVVALFAWGPVAIGQDRGFPPEQLRSGFQFMSPELQAMQWDDFGNPGMLWVERGAKLWSAPAGAGRRSCASCHGDAGSSMKGAAARYPLVDGSSGRLLTIEQRILQCRTDRQSAAAWRYESEELLSLTAYVAHQSRGMPLDVSIDGPARKHFDAGRAMYHRRLGQMNLACAHCHDANWGRTLFAERISQGHPNAYPAYRLEWQTLGSIERRLRACLSGIRAEMLSYGAQQYAELSLFLAWRAKGLPLETPGVRR